MSIFNSGRELQGLRPENLKVSLDRLGAWCRARAIERRGGISATVIRGKSDGRLLFEIVAYDGGPFFIPAYECPVVVELASATVTPRMLVYAGLDLYPESDPSDEINFFAQNLALEEFEDQASWDGLERVIGQSATAYNNGRMLVVKGNVTADCELSPAVGELLAAAGTGTPIGSTIRGEGGQAVYCDEPAIVNGRKIEPPFVRIENTEIVCAILFEDRDGGESAATFILDRAATRPVSASRRPPIAAPISTERRLITFKAGAKFE